MADITVKDITAYFGMLDTLRLLNLLMDGLSSATAAVLRCQATASA